MNASFSTTVTKFSETSKSYPNEFVIKEKLCRDYTSTVFQIYLSELQLIEHLEVDFLNEIPREIDGANPGNGTKSSTIYVIDLIVTQVQPSKKTHAAESVRIEFPDLIVVQIQNLQDGIPGKGSSKTKEMILECYRNLMAVTTFFKPINLFKSAIALCDMLHHPILTRSAK